MGKFFDSAGQSFLGITWAAAGGEPGGLAADVSFMVAGPVDPEMNDEEDSLDAMSSPCTFSGP